MTTIEDDGYGGYWELWQVESDLRREAEKHERAGVPGTANTLTLIADRIKAKHYERLVPKSTALSDPERDTWRKQVGALALALAEKGGKYKLGTRPNANQIAMLAHDVAAALPDASLRGVSKDHLREAITAGVKLLQGE